MRILFALLAITTLTACSQNTYGYKESPCACFEYEIFGGEKYEIENS